MRRSHPARANQHQPVAIPHLPERDRLTTALVRLAQDCDTAERFTELVARCFDIAEGAHLDGDGRTVRSVADALNAYHAASARFGVDFPVLRSAYLALAGQHWHRVHEPPDG